MIFSTLRIVLALFTSFLSVDQVFATNRLSVEGGTGSDSSRLARVYFGWEWNQDYVHYTLSHWHLATHWEAVLGQWAGGGTGGTTLLDAGLTPVFRMVPGQPHFPWVEAAIGVHVLSKTHFNAHRGFGSNIQFGSHVGMGFDLGENGQYELGYRFQHLSNGGIAAPNDGTNWHLIRIGYTF